MIIPGGNLSIKTAGFSIIFQYESNNSMLAYTMEEYILDSSEAAYENHGEQAPRGFMSLGGQIQ